MTVLQRWVVCVRETSKRTGTFHSLICFTTDPQPLPKLVRDRVRSSVSSSYLVLKIIQLLITSSSSSFRHIYPTLHLSFNNVFYKAVPKQVWPTQLAFLLSTVCRIFLCSLTVINNSSFRTPSVQWCNNWLTDWLFDLMSAWMAQE